MEEIKKFGEIYIEKFVSLAIQKAKDTPWKT
jgi:hypothetical protein